MFDADKYQRLMDGLEAVEMKLSEVLVDNENKRLDSEYFKKDLMSFLNHLNNLEPLEAV